MTRLEYLRKKGKLVHIDLSEEEIDRKWIRASHLCVCDECGKLYIDHPLIDNVGGDEPFLHLICNGLLVKL